MNSPFFSVIVPTYNRAGFIHKTIQSILDQQFENFEVLVVDDGSTDNTSEIIQGITDARIHYFKKENAERAAARNFGVAKAKGSFVTFLDSDDLLLPNHLSVAHNFVQLHRPEVFHLGYKLIDTHTGIEKFPERVYNVNEQILKGNLLSCIGIFIKREIALRNLFNETRSLSALEDWELWIRLAARYSFIHSAEVTSVLVIHESRSVMSVDIEKIKTKVHIFEELVKADPENRRVFGARLKQTYASIATYAALHLAMANASRKEILRYMWRGIQLNPAEIFKKRFFVIIKFMMGL